MECVACLASGRTTVRSNASWRHFCLNVCSPHEYLAAGHIKCVSTGPRGLDWIWIRGRVVILETILCHTESCVVEWYGPGVLFLILNEPWYFELMAAVFSALYEMPAWTSDEKGVCLSNACIVTKWKKDLSRFLYHMKDHLTYPVVSGKEEWLVWVTPSTWNFGSTGPRWSEIADF